MLVGQDTQRPKTVDELIDPALAARLDRLDIISRKIFAGKLPGERRSKRRGRSVEFDDYREYSFGDDLRHIDWNVYARLDRLFIKLFREEEDLAVHVVLDASASMDAGNPNKLVFAQRLAMAISYVSLVNQNRLCLSIVGARGRPELMRLAPVRGRRGIERAARFLLDHIDPPTGAVPSTGSPGLVAPIRQIAMSRMGAGVMVLLSDFLVREEIARGLDYLVAGRGGSFDTYCLQVLSPGELDPAAERDHGIIGDLRLTDAETGRGSEVTVSPALLKRYRQRLDTLCGNLHRACAARRMIHLIASSDTDVSTIVTDQLRRRGLFG